MDYVDFILNVAGLLLWLNWRAAKADPLGKRRPATLIGTLRRAEPGGAGRWQLPAIVGGLLVLRAVLYWQIGSSAGWNGKLDLGVTMPCFRSNLFGQMILFSVFSFARMLGIFYLWLLLLSILSGPDPVHRLVRIPLGGIDNWPRWAKFLLPLVVTALFWGLASWPFAGLHAKPTMSLAHRIEEALVIGLNTYLLWKFVIGALLALHLLNNYIYFGKHPFWNYVNVTAQKLLAKKDFLLFLFAAVLLLWLTSWLLIWLQWVIVLAVGLGGCLAWNYANAIVHTLLRPLEKIPLRVGKVEFAPVVGIALVFLLAEFAGEMLASIYKWLLP